MDDALVQPARRGGGGESARESIRVLVVALNMGRGGAERSTVDMVPYLAANGVEITVTCRASRPMGAEADLRASGFRLEVAADPRLFAWIRAVRRTIRSEQPDVVHTMLFQADLVGRVAALGLGVPVLSSVVNESYSPARYTDPAVRRWKLEVTRWIEGFTLRHFSDHAHALTQAVASAAVDRLGADPTRLTVVERGREPARLGRREAARRGSARARLGVAPDVPLVLCVGRQDYQKAHDTAVHAFALVRRELPEAVLVVAGRTGAATPAFEAAVDVEQLADSVVRTGHVSDVAELFCAADVLLFPSRFEGLGGVLLEAMTLELPIVASDIGPIRETVGGDDGALLVPVDQPELFAAAVLQLLRDPVRCAELTAHGRARVVENYSIEVVASRMAAMYRHVAAQGRLPLRRRWAPRRRQSSG